VLCEGAGFTVEVVTMDHHTPSLSYIVREKKRRNVDMARLQTLGLKPGPWMKELKDGEASGGQIEVLGKSYSLVDLRQELLVETAGDSVAYLTDFLLDPPAIDRLACALRGCRTIVCEGQYRHADLELAAKHFHSTTVLSATLAKQAQVETFVLFHLSDRYESEAWGEMLAEAREIFPNTRYPAHWDLAART